MVGIFFVVDNMFLIHKCSLDEAEKYGDFLIYPKSHMEIWDKHYYYKYKVDFDYYPRGTIVQTSLGPGLVCDTGGMEGTHIDIAVNWGKEVTWEG